MAGAVRRATTYTYNAYNPLTGTSAGAVLQYDAENRLVLTNSTSGAQREFLYDGADLIAEYGGSGALVARYVHGPGVDNPLVWFVGTDDSTPRYLTNGVKSLQCSSVD